ncbi:MAG: hypothetical protein ACRDB9_00465 [Cetobacterium sp.]
MITSRIYITGTLDREPKVNEDGTVDLILTNIIEEEAPKMIREKGSSVFLVKISKPQWKCIRNKISKDDAIFSIMGRVKASTNKKGTPFIYINADYIQINKKTEPEKPVYGVKQMQRKIRNIDNLITPWFKQLDDEDFIIINPGDVELVEQEHLESEFKYLSFKKLGEREDLYIAVKKIDSGKYGLVSGIKNFMVGKIYNKPFKAYVTELDREGFVDEFRIKEVK